MAPRLWRAKTLLAAAAACAARGEAESVTLRYFNIRGMAEPIRLLLAVAQVAYEEVKFESCPQGCPEGVTDWASFKAEHINTPILPFGQVPSLTYVSDSGERIDLAQSVAIQRFLARKYGLLADDTEASRARTDMIVGGIMDVRKRYGALVYNPAVAGKEGPAMIEAYKRETLSAWLPFFERLLGETGGDWFVGEQVSFVDTMALDMLESNLRVDPGCLDELPLLASFVRRITSLAGLRAYLQSSERRSFSNGASAAFDTITNPSPHAPLWFERQNGSAEPIAGGRDEL